MTPLEANEQAERLRGLLPKMTDAQVLAVAQKLDTFRLTAGQRAITAYAETNDEFILSRFMLQLRAEKERLQDVPRPQQKDYRYCESLRADMQAKGVKGVSGWSDAELIMRWGRAYFAKQGGFFRDEKTGKPENRCSAAHEDHIYREVWRTLYFELRFEEATAKRMADACFESPDFFTLALAQIRDGTVAPRPKDEQPQQQEVA